MRLLLIMLAIAGATGCSDRGSVPEMMDAGQQADSAAIDGNDANHDASADAGQWPDSGPSDAGPADSGGPPGEPDLGPDARPSDYPEAAAWRDTPRPALGPMDPSGAVVGDALPLDDDSSASGPPAVEWFGNALSVAWGLDAEGVNYRSYTPAGAAESPTVPLGATGGYIALAASPVGMGVASAPIWSGEPAALAVVDRDGGFVVDWLRFDGTEPDAARMTHGHWWVVTYQRGDETIASRGVGVDGTLSAETSLGVRRALSGPRIAGLRSRAMVAWPEADGVWVQSLSWPAEVPTRTPLHAISAGLASDSNVDAAAYRDLAVVATMDGTSVYAAMFDPWTDTVVAGPRVIGVSRILDRRIGLAPVETRGFLGACWPVGTGPGGGFSPHDGIVFQLFGPDLEPWGAPVDVITELPNAGGCAIAWTGVDFVVAWWLAGSDVGLPRIYVRRVNPAL